MNSVFFSLGLLFASSCCFGAVIQCKGVDGKPIFTDNSQLCHSEISEISTDSGNSFSSNLIAGAEINYRVPVRQYLVESDLWDVYYESGLVENDPELYTKARLKLEKTLRELNRIIPNSPLATLQGLKIYVMWGKASPYGGKESGMRYVRKGEIERYPYYDPRWENSIIIYSAENLVYLTDLWANKAIVHELAHAWHLLNWLEKHPPIQSAWQNAVDRGLYRNVKALGGKVLPSAYAEKNHLEYFAEISAMYFVGGNYYPFNKGELLQHDPQGYRMVETLWGPH